MTTRVRDWQSRLQACLAERWALPFAWGSQDCVMTAADCVLAVTGVDPAAAERGTYSTAKAAARVLKARGGLEAIAAAALGEEIAPLMARPGDIGLLSNSGQPCLAVCSGSTWLAPGPNGIAAFDISTAVKAWRVERPEN